jgi:hypothetical protein
MSEVRPFQAIGGKSFRVNNAVAATAQAVLPPTSDCVLLTNNSTTAIAYYRITQYLDAGDPPADSSANAPTTTTDCPIPASAQIRVYTAQDGMPKFIRLIASAADSYVTVTPGRGI